MDVFVLLSFGDKNGDNMLFVIFFFFGIVCNCFGTEWPKKEFVRFFMLTHSMSKTWFDVHCGMGSCVLKSGMKMEKISSRRQVQLLVSQHGLYPRAHVPCYVP